MKIFTKREQQLIKELKKYFHKIYGDKLTKILLYGSYARKTANRNKSDIDLLLVGKNFNNPSKEINTIIDSVASTSLKYNTLISVLPISETDFLYQNTPLIINIRKEGIEL